MNSDLLKVGDQLVAAAANGVYQGIIIALLVALCLRWLVRTNAATRHAIWFCTLLLLVALVVAHCLVDAFSFRRGTANGIAPSANTEFARPSTEAVVLAETKATSENSSSISARVRDPLSAYSEGPSGPQQPPLLVALIQAQPNRLSDKTKSELKMYWNFITRRLGQYKSNKVTTGMVKKLLESVGGGETNVTRKQYYRYIRMFFRWCVQEKHIKEDPTDGLRKIRIVPNEIKIYSPDDIERLLRLCEAKHPALLGFYCLTIFGGLRPTEAQKAEWQDITFESKEVFVKNHCKTGSRRFILRNADALWVWLTHIKSKYPNEPLNPTGNHNTFERKVRREFGGWIQDGLRHSFGTYYHNHTHDIAHVVYVMGNSIKIAKKHYVREVTKEWNDKFWSLKPTA